MPTVQDIWNNAPAVGYPGMVADGETSNRISRDVADAAGIGFGKFAYRSTTSRNCTGTPLAGEQNCWGVVITDHGLAVLPGGIAQDIVPQGRTAGIMKKGAIYVTTSVAVAAGDQVYVTPAGVITNISTSNVIAVNWFFDDTIAAAGVVRIANRT